MSVIEHLRSKLVSLEEWKCTVGISKEQPINAVDGKDFPIHLLVHDEIIQSLHRNNQSALSLTI